VLADFALRPPTHRNHSGYPERPAFVQRQVAGSKPPSILAVRDFQKRAYAAGFLAEVGLGNTTSATRNGSSVSIASTVRAFKRPCGGAGENGPLMTDSAHLWRSLAAAAVIFIDKRRLSGSDFVKSRATAKCFAASLPRFVLEAISPRRLW